MVTRWNANKTVQCCEYVIGLKLFTHDRSRQCHAVHSIDKNWSWLRRHKSDVLQLFQTHVVRSVCLFYSFFFFICHLYAHLRSFCWLWVEEFRETVLTQPRRLRVQTLHWQQRWDIAACSHIQFSYVDDVVARFLQLKSVLELRSRRRLIYLSHGSNEIQHQSKVTTASHWRYPKGAVQLAAIDGLLELLRGAVVTLDRDVEWSSWKRLSACRCTSCSQSMWGCVWCVDRNTCTAADDASNCPSAVTLEPQVSRWTNASSVFVKF